MAADNSSISSLQMVSSVSTGIIHCDRQLFLAPLTVSSYFSIKKINIDLLLNLSLKIYRKTYLLHYCNFNWNHTKPRNICFRPKTITIKIQIKKCEPNCLSNFALVPVSEVSVCVLKCFGLWIKVITHKYNYSVLTLVALYEEAKQVKTIIKCSLVIY